MLASGYAGFCNFEITFQFMPIIIIYLRAILRAKRPITRL
jgi:hypothetical protein